MKGKKEAGRLAARRKAFDAMKNTDGMKRPGSRKKPWPAGRGRSHGR